MQHHRRRRLPNLNRPPGVLPLSMSHLHMCLTIQLRTSTYIRQFSSQIRFNLRIRHYLDGYLPLPGGGRLCCFLAFEEVNDADGQEGKEYEGADYASGDCTGRGVVRRAGYGRYWGKRGSGICAWYGACSGRCIRLVN